MSIQNHGKSHLSSITFWRESALPIVSLMHVIIGWQANNKAGPGSVQGLLYIKLRFPERQKSSPELVFFS